MKKKELNYNVIIKHDTNDITLKWIICQHCKKPVYGTMVSDVYLPNKIITETIFKWTAPKTKRKKK